MNKKNQIIENPYNISEFIIRIHIEQKKHLDLLKLLKLLYICFGYISAYKNKIEKKNDKKYWLFDERIEAWELGPVVPKVYYHVRFYADYFNNYKIENVVSDKIDTVKKLQTDNLEIYNYVKKICEYYFKKKSYEMVNITHEEGSPWSQFFDGTPSREIPKEEIVKFYSNVV